MSRNSGVLVSSVFIMMIVVLASFAWANGGIFPKIWYGGFAGKISGTYLAVMDSAAQILQINEDGNLSFVASEQFGGGGVVGESYSDSLGTWKKTGRHEITATTVDIAFSSGDGAFVGVAVTTNFITFDGKADVVTMTCNGAVYPPGTDPFGPDAEPIPGSEYVCSEIEFRRVSVKCK